jgi:hypothetical protein
MMTYMTTFLFKYLLALGISDLMLALNIIIFKSGAIRRLGVGKFA